MKACIDMSGVLYTAKALVESC